MTVIAFPAPGPSQEQIARMEDYAAEAFSHSLRVAFVESWGEMPGLELEEMDLHDYFNVLSRALERAEQSARTMAGRLATKRVSPTRSVIVSLRLRPLRRALQRTPQSP